MDETVREPVLVDLALQGGGSHGAFATARDALHPLYCSKF